MRKWSCPLHWESWSSGLSELSAIKAINEPLSIASLRDVKGVI